MNWRRGIGALTAVCALIAASGPPAAAAAPAGPATTTPIKHFIYLMQGPRSFDNYFGTYPGADGFPAGECQSRGTSAGCVAPHSLHGQSTGLPSTTGAVVSAQVDGGKMDDFVKAYQAQGRDGSATMGYYGRADLPAEWAAADQYVLFDQFHSDAESGALANRTGWVAAAPPDGNLPTIFDQLQAAGVSWKFYVQNYNPKDTAKGANDQAARVPLLDYPRFLANPQLRDHIVDLSQYYVDLANGTLPAVAYVASSGSDERSAHSIPAGQKLIQTMINQLMVSKYWSSSAFFWSYEQSGGWYDQSAPPTSATGPLGLRVPALLVSAYAPQGKIDNTPYDPASALRFIEANWGLPTLNARDAAATSLVGAFDFAAGPRAPKLLPGDAITQAATATQPDAAPTIALYGSVIVFCLALLSVAAFAALRRAKPRAEPAGALS